MYGLVLHILSCSLSADVFIYYMKNQACYIGPRAQICWFHKIGTHHMRYLPYLHINYNTEINMTKKFISMLFS